MERNEGEIKLELIRSEAQNTEWGQNRPGNGERICESG